MEFALAASGLAILSGSAAAWAESDTQIHMRRACAAYDLHARIIIEEDGPKVSGTAVADAFQALVKARAACMAGRYVEGVVIYDTIALVPVRTTSISAASR